MVSYLAAQEPPSQPTRSALPNALRLTVGFLALSIAGLGVAVLPFVAILGRGLGAGGDGFQRFLIGSAVAIAGLFFLSVSLLRDATAREVGRSASTWLTLFGLTAAVGWAAFGVDSTRPLRTLPEARWVVPGAREVAVGVSPAEGGIGRVPRAELHRAFESDGSLADIEAFFTRSLPASGWTYTWAFGSTHGERFLNWDRGGFTFQVRLPDPDESWDGRFRYTIFGPRQ